MSPCSKKFVIEQLNGNKVIARKRGFTVNTCISAIPQSEETPEFQGLPTGEKVRRLAGSMHPSGMHAASVHNHQPDLQDAATSKPLHALRLHTPQQPPRPCMCSHPGPWCVRRCTQQASAPASRQRAQR